MRRLIMWRKITPTRWWSWERRWRSSTQIRISRSEERVSTIKSNRCRRERKTSKRLTVLRMKALRTHQKNLGSEHFYLSHQWNTKRWSRNLKEMSENTSELRISSNCILSLFRGNKINLIRKRKSKTAKSKWWWWRMKSWKTLSRS